jgi:iron complex outermembrane recepter protein
MKLYSHFIILLGLLSLFNITCLAQKPVKPVAEMSKEEMMGLSYDDLLSLSLEDLILVANKFGLSSDDLLEYFLNKDITSASKRSEKSMNSPLSTTVISKEEIMSSGAINIPEALRLAPGVIVREKTTGNYDIHIRGNDNVPSKNMLLYSENSLSLVMIDGRPVYNYAFGGTFWETLPVGLADIERIEIIRGPSSALYGPNAASGAINIITKTPDSKNVHVDAGFQAGNLNSKIADASVSFGIKDKLKFRFSGNYQHLDRFQEDFYLWGEKRYLPKDSIAGRMNPQTGIFYEPKINGSVIDPSMGADNYGVNGYLFYDLNKNVSASLSMGLQNSNILATVLGDHSIPINGRLSDTKYIDAKAKVYGFAAQVSYLYGDQDVERSNEGFHIYQNTLNSSLEYEYTLKGLTLRPGIGFQQAIYDDTKYLSDINLGYIKGKKELNSFAYYLRADYKLLEKIRLVAAVRADKYNYPDKTSLSYQFIGSYDANEKNVFRVVYSKANRGPFMADTYSNYNWQKTLVSNLKFDGNKDLNLATVTMIELGYRTKPIKNVQADFELFRSEAKDFSYFLPDSVHASYNPIVSPLPYPDYIHFKYENAAVVSTQYGFTASINVALNNKLKANVFGTVQETKLKNYYPLSTEEIVTAMTTNAVISGTMNSTHRPDSLISVTHKSTPSYYGGLSINYAPTSRINVNTSLYYYGKQIFVHKNETAEVSAKAIVNLKVSYKVYKNNAVFVNVRNLLNNESKEFAFTDRTGALYLLGVNMSF